MLSYKIKYIFYLIGILLTATSRLAAQSSSCTDQSSVSVIEKGTPIQRELYAGTRHSYLVSLQKGQVLEAEINQLGIDVIVLLFSPEKIRIGEIDSPEKDWGKEAIKIIAHDKGIYRIEVTSVKKTGVSGKYNIQINAVTNSGKYLSDSRIK